MTMPRHTLESLLMLEPSQIEFYREQGYLLVEDVIDATPARRACVRPPRQ